MINPTTDDDHDEGFAEMPKPTLLEELESEEYRIDDDTAGNRTPSFLNGHMEEIQTLLDSITVSRFTPASIVRIDRSIRRKLDAILPRASQIGLRATLTIPGVAMTGLPRGIAICFRRRTGTWVIDETREIFSTQDGPSFDIENIGEFMDIITQKINTTI